MLATVVREEEIEVAYQRDLEQQYLHK